LAAARMFGLEDFVPHVNTFKNKLDIPGYEVRYCFTKATSPKYSLRFKKGVDDPNEIYILMVGGPEEKTRRNPNDGYKSPPFRAIGWKLGADCTASNYLAPYGVDNYAVPVTDLNEMTELPEMSLHD